MAKPENTVGTGIRLRGAPRTGRPWLASAGLFSLALAAGCNRTHSADVVATVNGHAIMRADMDRRYQEQLGQTPGQLPSPEQADQLRLSVVNNLITQEILEQRAAKMNLTATAEEVNAKLADLKAHYTDQQFTESLAASHRTLDELKLELRHQVTIEKLMNKEINSKVTVSDANVTAYYNHQKADFAFIEPMYHLAEIRVTDVPSPQPGNLQGSKATTDAEAKKKVTALKVRLDSGDDFGALAMNYSENPETAPNGGDMGFVPESQLRSNPQVYDQIVKLKAGQFTEVIPLLDGETK
ncbi:MAG TPA: SurA N-terminal domain-containing protein, partial [Thermoanaerobaculia bacterium]